MSSREPIEIIAVSGPAGHGKGTVGKALDLFHGYTVVSLASGFKSELTSFEDGQLIKEVESAGYTVRRAWQQAGGDSRQRLNFRDLWCERLWSWIVYLSEFHPAPRSRFAICDFRYTEEQAFFVDHCERNGWSYLQLDVERPGLGNRAGTTHRSETDRSNLKPDIRLKNDGTRRDLALAVDRLLPGAWKFAGRRSFGRHAYTVSSLALANGKEVL